MRQKDKKRHKETSPPVRIVSLQQSYLLPTYDHGNRSILIIHSPPLGRRTGSMSAKFDTSGIVGYFLTILPRGHRLGVTHPRQLDKTRYTPAWMHRQATYPSGHAGTKHISRRASEPVRDSRILSKGRTATAAMTWEKNDDLRSTPCRSQSHHLDALGSKSA